jgi:hypothetical protein
MLCVLSVIRVFFTVFVLLLIFHSFSGHDSFAGAKYVSDDDNDSKDGAKYAGFGGASGNARSYNERSLGPAEGIGLTPVAAGPGVGVYAINKNVINIEKYADVVVLVFLLFAWPNVLRVCSTFWLIFVLQ